MTLNGIGYKMIDSELREALANTGWYFGYEKPYRPGSKPCYLPDVGNDYPSKEPTESAPDLAWKEMDMEEAS